MIKKLTKQGNSLALVIERPILDLLGADADMSFEVTTDGQVLILSPVKSSDRREAFQKALDLVNADQKSGNGFQWQVDHKHSGSPVGHIYMGIEILPDQISQVSLEISKIVIYVAIMSNQIKPVSFVLLNLSRLSVDIDLNYIGSLDRNGMLSDRQNLPCH